MDLGDSPAITKPGNLSIPEDEARSIGTMTADHPSHNMDSFTSGKVEDGFQTTDDNPLVSDLQLPHQMCERPAIKDIEKPDSLEVTQEPGIHGLQSEVSVSSWLLW